MLSMYSKNLQIIDCPRSQRSLCCEEPSKEQSPLRCIAASLHRCYAAIAATSNTRDKYGDC